MTTLDRVLSATSWRRSAEITIVTDAARAQTPDQLVELYSAEVWRFASSQLRRKEDAEDVVMEVYAAAFSNWSSVSRADDQRLWLLAVARRKVADSLRRKYRQAETTLKDDHATSSGFDDDQIATREALAGLPEHERQALVLKYVNGLSTEEVGAVMRKSATATNSLLQRARAGMRAALGERIYNATGENR